MRLHPDYNLALRLAGLLLKILFVTIPISLVGLWLMSLINPHWPIQDGLTSLIQWGASMGAIAIALVFLGSLWDAL